mmetsp:Transcript_56955/g.161604  ORF Transcript_56955/g.161604 Transcript_56955/m.161604 type:complete len:246 (-) Transcript_56955:14-751(-)
MLWRRKLSCSSQLQPQRATHWPLRLCSARNRLLPARKRARLDLPSLPENEVHAQFGDASHLQCRGNQWASTTTLQLGKNANDIPIRCRGKHRLGRIFCCPSGQLRGQSEARRRRDKPRSYGRQRQAWGWPHRLCPREEIQRQGLMAQKLTLARRRRRTRARGSNLHQQRIQAELHGNLLRNHRPLRPLSMFHRGGQLVGIRRHCQRGIAPRLPVRGRAARGHGVQSCSEGLAMLGRVLGTKMLPS